MASVVTVKVGRLEAYDLLAILLGVRGRSEGAFLKADIVVDIESTLTEATWVEGHDQIGDGEVVEETPLVQRSVLDCSVALA